MLEGVDSVEFGLVVAVTRVLDGDFTSHFVGSASMFSHHGHYHGGTKSSDSPLAPLAVTHHVSHLLWVAFPSSPFDPGTFGGSSWLMIFFADRIQHFVWIRIFVGCWPGFPP